MMTSIGEKSDTLLRWMSQVRSIFSSLRSYLR
jgi:hypothetical protein